MCQQRRAHQAKTTQRSCLHQCGVLTACINILSLHSQSVVCSHAAGCTGKHLYLCVRSPGMSLSVSHTRMQSGRFISLPPYKCRPRSPSPSIGAQSLTTDIVLIAHCGRVVSPHSHPDSLCAENPTMENSGLRVSEGLQTASVLSSQKLSSFSFFKVFTNLRKKKE